MAKSKKCIIAAVYIAIIVLTVSSIIIFGRSYKFYLPNPYNSEELNITFSQEEILKTDGVSFIDDYAVIKLKSIKAGKVQVSAVVTNSENQYEHTGIGLNVTVLPTGVIYITGYEYGGYQFTVYGMALLSIFTFAVCLYLFIQKKKTQFFSYKTMLYLALSVFFGLQGLMYCGLSGLCLVLPSRAEGWYIYNLAGFIMTAVFFITIPFLVIFAGFMSISNLSLIRHEGFRKNNLFGILISAFLFVGSLMCVIAAIRNPNSTGIELNEIRDAVIRSIVSSAFVYSECLLFSAMFCTQYAAKYEPKYNQDFIIILGCKTGKDGKPLPLLRGRIDRALDFYNNQLKSTGKKACFIPSGGKGSDEVISEAECMKNYLVEKGIDESIIYPETQSATTLENMKFSKQIADGHKENANILFSTTNYHVFRSGIFSAKAGMKADGIGAKTKWYFWPNAQMREFIGLLASEWKINILFIAATIMVSTLFANISTVVGWIAN